MSQLAFRFFWKKAQRSRWHQRTIAAESFNDAAAALVRQLRGRLQLADADFCVDHHVQAIELGGRHLSNHSLTEQPRDFQVFFNNKIWPPGTQVSLHG